MPGDTNGLHRDIFLQDRVANTTEIVSRNSLGEQGNNDSEEPDVSDDGRFVVFYSYASNLVPGDTTSCGMCRDVYVRDRQLGTTQVASVDSNGAQISASYILSAGISGNGRYVVFSTYAAVVPGVPQSGSDRTYVRDLQLGTTELASIDTNGAPSFGSSSSISDDGRYVTFTACCMSTVELRDRQLGTTEIISGGHQYDYGAAKVIGEGRYVVYYCAEYPAASTNCPATQPPGYSNYQTGGFILDRSTGIRTRVAVDATGASMIVQDGGMNASSDGRFVVWRSGAVLYLNDRDADADGVFDEPGATSVVKVSLDPTGASVQSDPESGAQVSDDGRYVAFASGQCTTSAIDTNIWFDVYLVDRQDNTPTPYDSDCDGVLQASDNCPGVANANQANADGDEYGDACEAANCVNVINHWTVPSGDSDCDGFPDSVLSGARGPESTMGTDAALKCPATAMMNDEAVDAWPVDNNDKQVVNGQDVLVYNYVFGHSTSDPPVNIPGQGLRPISRFDLNASGMINGADILQFNFFFGKRCTP